MASGGHAPEIRVRTNELGQFKLEPLRDGKPYRTYIPDLLAKDRDRLYFVFDCPMMLKRVLDVLKGNTAPQGTAIVLMAMERVRLCLKSSSTTHATGTTLGAWKEVLEGVPSGNSIQAVKFDLSLMPQDELDAAARLVKDIIDTLTKRRGPCISCNVTGCSEELKRRIEQASGAG